MPAYQQALGTVSGSSGTPCANAGGDCREGPDVSADADPSSGYVIYDSVNGLNWSALGGTSGAVPLWAAVVAVVAPPTATQPATARSTRRSISWPSSPRARSSMT